jgi:hypothetical protein
MTSLSVGEMVQRLRPLADRVLVKKIDVPHR